MDLVVERCSECPHSIAGPKCCHPKVLEKTRGLRPVPPPGSPPEWCPLRREPTVVCTSDSAPAARLLDAAARLLNVPIGRVELSDSVPREYEHRADGAVMVRFTVTIAKG